MNGPNEPGLCRSFVHLWLLLYVLLFAWFLVLKGYQFNCTVPKTLKPVLCFSFDGDLINVKNNLSGNVVISTDHLKLLSTSLNSSKRKYSTYMYCRHKLLP